MKIERLKKISKCVYEVPRGFKPGMRVPARIFASDKLIMNMDDAVLDQISNTAMLPGIQKYALCMPDGHSGYGFPIGGVVAIDPEVGVISPGGIGFDINCGIRLVATSLTLDEINSQLRSLVDKLFKSIPSGVGVKGKIKLSDSKLDDAMLMGAQWAIENGYGKKEDLEYIEDEGCIKGANPHSISAKARDRGRNQIGTLGSGNHFIEIQVAKKENIFDQKIAREFGIFLDNQIVIMIHTGSRAFGHQVASDYLQRFSSVMQSKYCLSMPDRELSCAPFYSEEGKAYFEAMNCAINIAFVNRQVIMHRIREVCADLFKKTPDDLGIRLVYDICHNTAKLENHNIDGMEKNLLIHRKGATRSFPKGMEGLPSRYMGIGQPVIIAGSMESGSYLLVGSPDAKETFYSAAHGSGRLMSRKKARKLFSGKEMQKELEKKGIYIQTDSYSALAEEAGGAYKNIDDVIDVTSHAGLSKPVVKLVPVGNIKG